MSAQHTPGPWYAKAGRVLDSCGNVLAIAHNPPAEYESNARLIAAAPALLEALRAAHSRMVPCVDAGDEGEIAAEIVQAAIAAAEGRT